MSCARCQCRQCQFGYHCGPCSKAFRLARKLRGIRAARNPSLRSHGDPALAIARRLWMGSGE